jgi:hypothetical protein
MNSKYFFSHFRASQPNRPQSDSIVKELLELPF